MISCCDSRAAPETIFDAAPGEIFVLRNVANLVPPYAPDGEYHGTSAALEFAVQVLKVKHIVVMGHGRCGGVHAFREQYEGLAAEPLSPGDFIGKWISLLEPATKDIRCEDVSLATARQRALEEASVRQGIANLATFPCVNILLQKGRIAIHGAWFDIGTGELWLMEPSSGDFFPCSPPNPDTGSRLARTGRRQPAFPARAVLRAGLCRLARGVEADPAGSGGEDVVALSDAFDRFQGRRCGCQPRAYRRNVRRQSAPASCFPRCCRSRPSRCWA